MMIDEITNQLVEYLIPYINKLKLYLSKKKKNLNFITVTFAICLLK